MKYIVGVLLIAGGVSLYAAEEDIIFPVVELGNCVSKEACREYCEDLEHMDACINFAEANGLMSEEEADRAESFREDMEEGGGPGGCESALACENYCTDISHLNECIAFAEEHGHEGGEIEDGRRIQAYLSEGGSMPGGCTGRDSCEDYCSSVDHMDECIAFAEKAGISMRDGHTGEDLTPEQMRDILTRMKEGRTPGGCKSKDECESYCGGGEHFEECISFAEEMGFMSHEEAEMARKTGGVGPGGCNSRESCEAFCNSPDNQQTCFDFSKEHGIMREEDLERMRDGAEQMRGGLEQAPPETRDCVQSVLGAENMEKMMSEGFAPNRDMAMKLQECFQNMRPSESENHPPENSMMQPEMTPEEIEQYRVQYEEQTKQEFDRQYQEQYQQQYQYQGDQQIQQQEQPPAEFHESDNSASIWSIFNVLLAPLLR